MSPRRVYAALAATAISSLRYGIPAELWPHFRRNLCTCRRSQLSPQAAAWFFPQEADELHVAGHEERLESE